MANPISHHLLLPLAGDYYSDDEEEEVATAALSFPSFWPPFPSLLSDSDSDAPFPSPMAHHSSSQETASSFLGLDFHGDGEEEDGVWGPPDEEDEEDMGLPLCWDCLQLEDHHRWDLAVNETDEWEQVADREDEEDSAAAASAVRSLEWEVLLAASSLGNLVVGDDEDGYDDGGIETYFLDDADEALFGQLSVAAEHEAPAKGGPPAAKVAVEGLPTVVVAEADATRGDTQCAVCKDGIAAGEEARRLPCSHLYHDGCILPWLAIRNTCPLCRHELPTDDPEYEKWKARRAGTGDTNAIGDSNRYEFARLP